MSPDQIDAFIAVVQSGSFRSASKVLNKTQSTISASVKNLEESIGIKLLDRNHYRPVLTPHGEAFFAKAKEFSKHFRKLRIFCKQLEAGDEPYLSIVLSGICALPPILKTIKHNISEYPQTQFSIATEHMSGVVEKLNTGEADLAIGPDTGLNENYEYSQIGSIAVSSIATVDYIGISNSPISQESMHSHVHILVEDSGRETPVKHLNVIPGGQCWYVNDYATKKELILAGLGWGRLPLHMVINELKNGQLQEIQIEGIQNKQNVPIFNIKTATHPSGPIFQNLWDGLTFSRLS